MCNSSVALQNLRFPQPAILDFYASDYDYHAICVIWIGFAHIHGLWMKMIKSMYLFDRLVRVFHHCHIHGNITSAPHQLINKLLISKYQFNKTRIFGSF